jgi:hypothetical protein
MNGIEQLHPKNQTLYIRVQVMLNQRARYEEICDIIGLVGSNRVNELCEWFIAYKTPKQLPKVRTGAVLDIPVRAPSLIGHGVRLSAWQRQRDGARKALEATAQ